MHPNFRNLVLWLMLLRLLYEQLRHSAVPPHGQGGSPPKRGESCVFIVNGKLYLVHESEVMGGVLYEAAGVERDHLLIRVHRRARPEPVPYMAVLDLSGDLAVFVSMPRAMAPCCW